MKVKLELLSNTMSRVKFEFALIIYLFLKTPAAVAAVDGVDTETEFSGKAGLGIRRWCL